MLLVPRIHTPLVQVIPLVSGKIYFWLYFSWSGPYLHVRFIVCRVTRIVTDESVSQRVMLHAW